MRDRVAERVFSLFTSPDRAEALCGDLIEERPRHGDAWFWTHVARTALSLWRSAVMERPLRVLALALSGAVLFLGPAMSGAMAIGLFPQLFGSLVSTLILTFFWGGGAMWVGGSLVNRDIHSGMAACLTLALIAEMFLIGTGTEALALMMPLLLLTGGVVARRRMLARPLLGLCLLLAVAASAAAQTPAWKDPSPHTATLVTVDADVQLEVLDWGGTGPAVVLLAGLGATAHQYDDLAPLLARKYRVIGVTRRGHRGSSAAPAGYAFDRLAADVMRVIESTGLRHPVVIGHSFAGEEMHVLGSRHAQAIRGLIYIDAAFNRGDDSDSEAFNAVARSVPAAPGPAPADLASFGALRAYSDKHGGAGPEGHLRARFRENPDGTVAGAWAPEAPVRQAMMKDMQAAYRPYNPARIAVPALAIYAMPKSAEDLILRGSSDRRPFPDLAAKAAADQALRENVEKLFVLARDRVRKHEAWFKAFAEGARIVELSGTHDLIVSNPRDVLAQIDAFMASLLRR